MKIFRSVCRPLGAYSSICVDVPVYDMLPLHRVSCSRCLDNPSRTKARSYRLDWTPFQDSTPPNRRHPSERLRIYKILLDQVSLSHFLGYSCLLGMVSQVRTSIFSPSLMISPLHKELVVQISAYSVGTVLRVSVTSVLEQCLCAWNHEDVRRARYLLTEDGLP